MSFRRLRLALRPGLPEASRETFRGYVKVGQRYLAPSVMLLWSWLLLLVVGLVVALGYAARAYLSSIRLPALGGAALLAAYALGRNHPTETRLVWLSLVLGVVIAAVLLPAV